MGNYVSCALSTNSSRSAKVILPGGEIRQIHAPTKAAELMLEHPNHFLVDAKSMKISHRFSPLNADEDIELGGGRVYVMFPMKRVASAITAADMGTLFIVANKKFRFGGNHNRVRISPAGHGGDETSAEAAEPRLSLEDIAEFLAPEIMHRVSVSRSKKPLLATIDEEPVGDSR